MKCQTQVCGKPHTFLRAKRIIATRNLKLLETHRSWKNIGDNEPVSKYMHPTAIHMTQVNNSYKTKNWKTNAKHMRR
jgi:hypothetical protein